MSRSARNHRDLTRYAESLGWVGRRTASSHYRWTHPEVEEAIVTACSPGGDFLKVEKARFRRLLDRARAGTLPTSAETALRGRRTVA